MPVNESHIEGFHAAVDFVARERKYLARFKAASLEATRNYVWRNIEHKHPHFVAIARDRVIGWCDITPDGHDASPHVGILGIGLMPDFRGRGLGRKLMEATIDAAWRYPFTRIELTVNDSNGNALRLYEKMGFQLEGCKRKAEFVDGAYRDVYVMGLLKE